VIFVTVGTQLPFARLVHAVDAWAARSAAEVFAQVGPTKAPPRHIQWSASVTPAEFNDAIDSCSLIIAHAGMGTIISALKARKPLLVMPRRANLGEHRNEHQLATVKALAEQGKITAASDEQELVAWLERQDEIPCPPALAETPDERLLLAVRDFIGSRRSTQSRATECSQPYAAALLPKNKAKR